MVTEGFCCEWNLVVLVVGSDVVKAKTLPRPRIPKLKETMLRLDKVKSKAHKVFNRIELNKPLLVPHADIDRLLATA